MDVPEPQLYSDRIDRLKWFDKRFATICPGGRMIILIILPVLYACERMEFINLGVRFKEEKLR